MQPGVDGRCAIFGCPLFGTLGRGNEWVCFCHHDANAGDLQRITAELNRQHAIADSVVETRMYRTTDEWRAAYGGISQRLREANRADLLPKKGETSRAWLARLEGALLDACREVQSQHAPRYVPKTTPTAPVIGPTHASGYMPDQGGKE
jgi:hypothetical protein